MKTILCVVLLGVALGVWAYVWSESYHNRPVTAQAVATDLPKAAESVTEEFDINAAKQRCFDASKEAILKELKSPRTARFPNVISDVRFQRGEADSYQMSSYVDAQNALGALIRMTWETLFDKNEKLVWMKIDDDELEPLEDVLRRLKGLPPRVGEEGDRVSEATEDSARKKLEEQNDPKNREPLHAYAQQYVTSKLALQSHHDIKHSKLLKRDDKDTACYWLGNDVWEATGMVQSIPPYGTRPLRQSWKISMAVSNENKPEVMAYKLGNDEIGEAEVARIRAGVKPTMSK